MIEEIFERIERETGFMGGIVRVFETEGDEVKAGISLTDWKVEIEIGRKSNFEKKFIRDILLHEVAHWKICPKDIMNHYLLHETALNYFPQGEISSYMVNAFEDLIVNTWNRFKNPPYEGQIEFFKLQISKNVSKFYKFFVILNLYLMDEKNRIKNLFPDFNSFNKNNREMLMDIENIIQEWKIPENLSDKILFIENPKNWENMFKVFLEVAKKYFDFSIIPLSAFEPTFEKEAVKKENIEKYILYKIKKGETPGIISNFEFLDNYYKLHTPFVRINLPSNSDFEIPYVKFGKQKFDPENHSFFDIDWKLPFFDPESPFERKINFYIKPFNQGIKVKGGERKSFPDFLAILDSSGSMTDSGKGFLPWGEKYHNAILGIYAVFSFLERTGVAPYIKYCLVQFSNHTVSTGWLSYSELKIFKEKLFSPKGEGTNLNTGVIENVLNERRSEKFVLLITDSEIFNWNYIKEKLLKLLSLYHTFFFQIGKDGVASDLLKKKFDYIQIENPKDLAGKIIEISKNVYL